MCRIISHWLCHSMLHRITLCHTMSHRITLCHIVSHRITQLCHSVSHRITLCLSVILCHSVSHSVTLCHSHTVLTWLQLILPPTSNRYILLPEHIVILSFHTGVKQNPSSFSFCPKVAKTIPLWNNLPSAIVLSPSQNSFKTAVLYYMGIRGLYRPKLKHIQFFIP